MKMTKHSIQVLGLAVIGLLLFILTYHETFTWLYERYTAVETYYSHGFLIPLIVGYLIYTKRESLVHTPISYSYAGLMLIGASLVLHVLSALIHVYFISGFSMLILIIGMSLFLFGGYRTKIIIAPLLYLVFMLPLPLMVIQMISLPLKSFVTAASVAFTTQFLGIQTVQAGFLINLADGVLTIGNPCSGLRSIFSFLALGTFFLMINRFSIPKRVSFLLLCIPIALFSNILRVLFLIIVGSLIGAQNVTEGSIYHDFSGYAVFVFGLVLMSTVWNIFKCKNFVQDN